MNICIVHRYPPSLLKTSDMSFPTLVNKLIERGHKVYFLGFKENGKLSLLENVSYEPINLTFNRVKKFDRNFKSVLFVFMVPFLSFRLAFREKIDLFYCHDSLPGYGFLIKMAVNCRTRVVVRLGDLMTGYLFDEKNKIGNLLFKIISSVERAMLKRVDGLVSISSTFRDFLIAQGLPEDKISVVEESVDITKFSSCKFGERLKQYYGINKGPLIAVHGIVVPWKGIETLLKAVPLVLNHVPDAQFIIVGDGPSLGGLKDLVKELQITDHVIFTGWITYQRIPDYLGICDVGVVMRRGGLANNFVLTTALLQLWACGKPVVAPNLGAISQVIMHGKNGLLFRPDDPEDLATKIVHLIMNPNMAKKFGEEGIMLASKKFDCRVIGNKFATTIESYAKKELHGK